jgi:hypothetical protein
MKLTYRQFIQLFSQFTEKTQPKIKLWFDGVPKFFTFNEWENELVLFRTNLDTVMDGAEITLIF